MEIEGQPDHGPLIQSVPPPQVNRGLFSRTGIEEPVPPVKTLDMFNVQDQFAKKHLLFVDKIKANSTETPMGNLTFTWGNLLNHWMPNILYSSFRLREMDTTFTFWLNKPVGVTGKIKILWHVDGGNNDTDHYRTESVLWDLSATDYVCIKAPYIKKYKHLVTRRVEGKDVEIPPDNSDKFNIINFAMPIVNIVQPGSIYPDSYNLYVFMSCDNINLSSPCSPYVAKFESLR